MSGIGKHVAQDRGPNSVTWFVQCYTLSDIFENYWFIEKVRKALTMHETFSITKIYVYALTKLPNSHHAL